MQFKPVVTFSEKITRIEILFLPGNTGNGIFANSIGAQSSSIKFELNRFTSRVSFDIPNAVDPRTTPTLNSAPPSELEITQPTLNATVPYYLQFFRDPTK